jgi:hypothetical protein
LNYKICVELILQMPSFKYVPLVIFIISYLFKSSLSKICKVKKAKINFHNVYDDEMRFLQSTNSDWAPIRIYVDYTHLETQDLKPEWVAKLKEVMSKTVSMFQSLVIVRPVVKNLILTKCDDNVVIGDIVATKGVATDLVIIPLLDHEASSMIAWAYSCAMDSKTNRPVMGVIGWSSTTDFGYKNWLHYYTMVALHELTHVLAFNTDLYPYFIDASGKTLGIENIVTNKTVNGEPRMMIKTPRVRAAAAQHFGCSSIEGVELEEFGGEATAGSHWEARVMLGDYMTGQDYQDVFISKISLALFEDSGWYKINYYTGGLFRFGKNEGCDFINSKCIIDGKVKFGNEFCNVPGGSICSSSRASRGFCLMYSKNDTETLPSSSMDYFVNMTGHEIADYCPVSNSYDFDGTYNSQMCTMGVSYYPSSLGESISANSTCFMSSLTPQNDNAISAYKRSSFAICYQIQCSYSDRTYTVTIGEKSVKCSHNGGKVTLNGFDGFLYCADFNLVCTQPNGQCSNAIDCVEKKILPNAPLYDYQYDDNMNFNDSILFNPNILKTNDTISSILPYAESLEADSSSRVYVKPVAYYYLLILVLILTNIV